MIDKNILIELVGKLHITLGLPPIRGGQLKKSWLLREYSRFSKNRVELILTRLNVILVLFMDNTIYHKKIVWKI